MKTIISTLMLTLMISTTTSASNGPNDNNPKTLLSIKNWVNKNVNYPKASIENQEEGTVYVAFSISEKGTVEGAEVVGSVSDQLDLEALKTVNQIPMNDFIYEHLKDKVYILPIKFAIK